MGEAVTARALHLFDAYGIELEYMIVGTEDLRVRPLCDEVLKAVTGAYVSDYDAGPIAWSNELVAHVIELKTNGPAAKLDALPQLFLADLRRIQELLRPWNARLLPTAMHPTMDPLRETVLWPHESNPVYEKFDAIFDCRGHGWSNLQSMHINLPFHGDEEFGRLHAAIRFLLPILPCLAASSPIVDGRVTSLRDNRMEFYRTNSARVPSLSGLVVPEPASTRAEYEASILQPIYDDLAPFDPEGILRYEWANARGCIARFDRDTIEIRVIDVQETPRADLAIAALVSECLRKLVAGDWIDQAAQNAISTKTLATILGACVRDAELARIDEAAYLAAFGGGRARTGGELWQWLFDQTELGAGAFGSTLRMLLERGSLARRIARAVGERPQRARIHEVYAHLGELLLADELFDERAI